MLLFGLPDSKDEQGSSAWDDDGPVQSAIRAIRAQAPGLPVMTDVCLCQYTSHGACGVLRDGEVDNDATLPLLARVALSHARAGADAVAPSDMMDGRVAALRSALDGDGPRERRHLRLQHEVRLGLLRPVPRRGRLRAQVRRSQGLPARPGQRAARPCARRCSTRPRAPTR